MVKNVASVGYLVFVKATEDEQQSELTVGQNTTITGILQPIEVSAVNTK